MNIVLASDKRYFVPMAVCLSSILLSQRRDIDIDIYILDGGIDDKSFNKIILLANQYHSNCRVHRKKIDLVDFSKYKSMNGSHMAYARILIGSLFKELGKVIYLDVDIICLTDLYNLWNEDFCNNTICACPDPYFPNLDMDCPTKYYLEKHYYYFNSGVLLIDLNKWRGKNIEKQTLKYLDKYSSEVKFWDQTALNFILKDEVKYISSSYNKIESVISKENRFLGMVNIHYATSNKPWHGFPKSYEFTYTLWWDFYFKYVSDVVSLDRKLLNKYRIGKIKSITSRKYLIRKYTTFRSIYLLYLWLRNKALKDANAKRLMKYWSDTKNSEPVKLKIR